MKIVKLINILVISSVACIANAAPPVIEPVDVNVTNDETSPVSITGTVGIQDTTVLLSDAFYTVDQVNYHNAESIGPIDIEGFKTIRVVLRRGSCSGCANEPTAYIRTVGTATSEARTIDVVHINNPDLDIGTWATRTYDVAGTGLLITLLSDDAGASYTVRVMVFGRVN